MNQNVCPKCQTPNVQNSPFCVNCGQPLAPSPAGYANTPPPAGGAPSYSPNQPNAGREHLSQPSAQKKSRMGMWLAIIGGVLVLGVIIIGIGVAGIWYYVSSRQSEFSYNYNSNSLSDTYGRNTTLSNTYSANTTTATDSTTAVSTAMSDNDKYRLFYAATKIGDQPLQVKVSRKIGIIDQSGQPTPYFTTFTTGMRAWATKDVEFIKKTITKEQARAYLDSQMPGE